MADRGHLVRNLGQTLESLLDTRRALLRQAMEKASAVEMASESVTSENREEPLPVSHEPAGKPPKVTRSEQLKQCHRQERLDRYLEVQQLYRQGLNVSGISRQMHLDPKTVRKYLRVNTFIDRKERAPQKRGRMLDAYGAYLRQQWEGGCHNVAQLYRELTEQGYRGCYTSVKDYVKAWRQPGLAGTEKRPPRVSPRQVVYWMLRKTEDRSARQQSVLEKLSSLCEPFRVAWELTQRFLAFIRQAPRTEQGQEFRSWLGAALACDVAEMRGYAASLQQDQAAVEAGLSLPWSNGSVEGSVNRLKFVKRRGYGRSNFDLLRKRVLQPT